MRTPVALLTICAWLALAAPAFARDNGEGLLGETDDKVVTLFSLGVLLFFVVVVTLGTVAQILLERRKQQIKQQKLRQRTGW